MATKFPADKYAFLFTGPTLDPHMKDLENVFQTLTEYYNYPASNITIVLGSTPAVAPSFSGATVITAATATDLQTALTTFRTAASGASKTALLYFTGGGISESGVSKLVIDDGDGSNNVDPTWLAAQLSGFSCHVNVVMQQSFSGGFISAMTGSGLAQWSFTSACGGTEECYGNNVLGGFFTHGWVKGLKLEALPAGTLDAGKYADEMDGSTERLVSLEEAKEFGKQVHDLMGFAAFSTPSYNGSGGPHYLGEPAFLIRDGSTKWYESPDIYLTHPDHPWVDDDPINSDLYIPDMPGSMGPFNNTINVDVRNVGTHPVRIYSLGVGRFKMPSRNFIAENTECNKIPSDVILFPINLADIGSHDDDKKDTYQWNTPFYDPSTHQCAIAEAARVCSDIDTTFSLSVLANDFEAQRNIDQMTIIPPPPVPTPFLGNLQGFMEHLYGIENHFATPRRFVIVIPEEYQKYRDVLELKWFAAPLKKESEIVPIDVEEEPVPHISLSLKSGEARDILLRAEMKPDFDVEGGVKLPFEVLVEGDWKEGVRRTALAANMPTYAPIAGFTLLVRKGSSTLEGTVLGRENKPVAEAKIFLRTVNDRQGAVLTTDKNGHYAFPDINPNVYRIWAEDGNWRSKEQIVVLLSGKEETFELQLSEEMTGGAKRVRVILDKIRIMDDHDPILKGRGELTFTSVVVPDDDVSRKKVTRLPPTGVYKISDKPGENELRLDVTLFDGLVKNRALSITISGKEIDLFDPDDVLGRYHREFSGDPETWYGQYYPTDEYLDKENVGDWALWYRVVRS